MHRSVRSLLAVLVVVVLGLTAGPGASGAQEPPPPSPDGSEAPAPDGPDDEDAGRTGDVMDVEPVDPEVIATFVEANAELARLDGEIATATWEVAALDRLIVDLEAERQLTARRIHTTERLIEQSTARITSLQALLRERAVDAYMADGVHDSWIDDYLEGNPHASTTRNLLLELADASDADLIAELDDQRTTRQARRDRLSDRQDDLAEQREQLDGARAEKGDLLERLAALRTEAQEQTDLARIGLEAALAHVASQQEAIDAAIAAAQAGQVPNGFSLDGQPLCDAAGITVTCELAPRVILMVAAAAEDGVTLSGGGWRSTLQQIQLRMAHCGGDVYGAPASSCSPPTARPGSSQHEMGQAIDFEDCSTRATACYQWLAENASHFGFENLPSEPWHWSTTGR